MDLARNQKSILRGLAPAEQKDVDVEWHGRTIKGRAYMRDLLDLASKGQALPPINTADTDHDFAVFISNRPCGDKVTDLAKKVGDARTLGVSIHLGEVLRRDRRIEERLKGMTPPWTVVRLSRRDIDGEQQHTIGRVTAALRWARGTPGATPTPGSPPCGMPRDPLRGAGRGQHRV
jgi:hypothetical protein